MTAATRKRSVIAAVILLNTLLPDWRDDGHVAAGMEAQAHSMQFTTLSSAPADAEGM